MSMANIVIEKDRALIGFDTLAGFMNGAELHMSDADRFGKHTCKVSLFPHMDMAMTHRGDALLTRLVQFNLDLSLAQDFDQAVEYMHALLPQAHEQAMTHRKARFNIESFEGAEVILVGWSKLIQGFDAVRWMRYPGDPAYICTSASNGILLPATDQTDEMALPADAEAMERVARHQVEWARREYPSYPVGGRLMLVHLRRGSLSVREIADLGG